MSLKTLFSEGLEQLLEVLGEVADGCKSAARAFKSVGQAKPPVVHNKIEVPKQATPEVHNHINVPSQAASPPPIINFLPNMWAGEIKVHRHPNGLVSHYTLKPDQSPNS